MQVVSKPGDDHRLTWGLKYGFDDGESPDDEQFTITTPATGRQKASPDSLWQNAGVYLEDEYAIDEDWSLLAAARVDYFHFKADGNDFYTIPGSTAPENVVQNARGTDDETALTGGLALTRYVDPDWMVYGSWFRGYRLFPPGFGLRQTGYGILAPTDGLLDPITGDQFEIGTRVRRDGWGASFAAYYTDFDNFQQPVPGTYLGNASLDLDGSGTIDPDESIFVVEDKSDGYVTGIEAQLSVDLSGVYDALEGWTWTGGTMWNYGNVDTSSGEEPLRHTHPLRFLTSLRWDDPHSERHRWFEVVADLVDKYTKISDGRLNGDVGYLKDPQDSGSGLLRSYGLPGYSVFDIRGGIQLSDSVTLTLGLENLFDAEYRTAHSRMDAPGRSLEVGIEILL
jgi:outer membrane receptor protein involved in Fe transport